MKSSDTIEPQPTKTFIATTQIAALVRDVEVLMQSPDTVEIGQLASLITRLNGEFGLLRARSASSTTRQPGDDSGPDVGLLAERGDAMDPQGASPCRTSTSTYR